MMIYFIHVYSGDSSGDGNNGILIGRITGPATGRLLVLNNRGFTLFFQKGRGLKYNFSSIRDLLCFFSGMRIIKQANKSHAY